MIGIRRHEGKILYTHPLSSYVPILAIVIIVLLTGLFAWTVSLDRRDEQHNELIRNALWVEQALSFQLQSIESKLANIVEETGSTADSLESNLVLQERLQHFKTVHPELLRVIIWDQQSQLQLVRPASAPLPEAKPVTPKLSTWLPAEANSEFDEPILNLLIPVFHQNVHIGSMQASFSLKRLLNDNVPWWIAEHYHLSLINTNEQVLAERSQARLESDAPQHSMSIDPPLNGLRLLISPYRNSKLPTFQLLLAVVVGLAVLAVINLIVQHHYARRRRAAEQALLQEQAFRHAMENSIVTGMRARDMDGRILYVNPAFARLVGLDQKDIIGLSPPMPWWQPDTMDETRARRHRLNRVPSVQVFETQFQRADGAILDVQVFESPLIDTSGQQVGWIGSIIDISSRKRDEALASTESERLHQTAKLINMGEMASTLAHELNQPLSAIASYAAGTLNLLQQDTLDRQLLTHGVQSLAEQTRRAGLIIHRIHDFVRKRDPQFQPLVLQHAVHDALTLAKKDLGKHHLQPRLQLPETDISVLGDKVLLEQVLYNLIRNAAEAMSDLPAERHQLDIHMQLYDSHVLVKVSDQGPGVDPDVIADVFQAFTTTKTEGLGIGLNVCRSIIELHHGQLWFENDAKYGATFFFTLPLHQYD